MTSVQEINNLVTSQIGETEETFSSSYENVTQLVNNM